MWTPNLLSYDLTFRRATYSEEIPHSDLFLGGRGLASLLAYQYIPENCLSLDERNALIFSTGPLTGSSFPGTSGALCTTKSPLSNGLVHSPTNANFGKALKELGIDTFLISGSAKYPSVVLIEGPKFVEIEETPDLVGKSPRDTIQWIEEEFGPATVLTIGSAGEKELPTATTFIGTSHRFNGAGVGSIVGSKKIKAIALIKSKKQYEKKIHFSKEVIPLIRQVNRSILKNDFLRSTLGFSPYDQLQAFQKEKMIPLRNYHAVMSPKMTLWSREEFTTSFPENLPCHGCPGRCFMAFNAKGIEELIEVALSDIIALGFQNNEFNIAKIKQVIKESVIKGFNTKEIGLTLASIIELGIKQRIPGLHWEWKSHDAFSFIASALESKGFSLDRFLRNGPDLLMKRYNDEPACFKRITPEQINFRNSWGALCCCGVSSEGGANRSWFPLLLTDVFGYPFKTSPIDWRGREWQILFWENYTAICESLGVCLKVALATHQPMWISRRGKKMQEWLLRWFPRLFFSPRGFDLDILSKVTSDALGTTIGWNEFMLVARRTLVIERLFNYREGLSIVDDLTIPKRFTIRQKNDVQFNVDRFKDFLLKYYKRRRFRSSGVIPSELLNDLKISDTLFMPCERDRVD